MLPSSVRAAAVAGTLALFPLLGSEGQAQTADPSSGPAVVIDGSPSPVPPESITRDALGRATVRAIRLSAPLSVDGRLDEEVYSQFQPFGDFVQVAPVAGAPSSERTDVWVMYDDTHIYVACRCWDSTPPDQWIVNEYRRDTNALRQNDHFGVMFDTFYDRRSGFMFYANPLGARADYSVIDEGGSNTDWDPVWEVQSDRFEGGWTMEMAIPFKSLRYLSGPDQVWGFQARRAIRHRNEWTYLNPVPPNLAGPQALNRISAGGTLVGLDLPPASRNLELKPYAITGVSTDRTADPAIDNRVTGDVGIDLKYGLTANLTADFTLNTDFAQVEIDEQQINLTRFNLSFPEKREFFLEGRGNFAFGGGGGFGGGGDAPSLFYSRRIGLDQGRVIPIQGGARLTGKVGDYGLGLMSIQAGAEPSVGVESTNFTVVRVKRDILRRSAIGAIFTNRSVSATAPGSNQAFGVDASFGFFTNLQLDTYWARTRTQGLDGEDESYRANLSYGGDRYGFGFERLKVGEDFNPGVGFARRDDFVKSSGSLRFSPRPASISFIRKLTWQVDLDYYETGAGALESRSQGGRFNVEFENSDGFTLSGSRAFERLPGPFRVGTGVVLPAGDYGFDSFRTSYSFGPQRRVSGNVSLGWGEFYDGTIRSVGISGSRVVVSNRLSLEPSMTINRIDVSAGELTQKLFRTRADYAFTSRMFAGTLLQYNAGDHTLSSNLRFRWEYHPGSELFIVWTDERQTGPGGDGLRNRALAIKATRLLRF